MPFDVLVDGATWDVAINVGTNDDDDLLKYKLVYDFRHSLRHLRRRQQDLTTHKPDRSCGARLHPQRYCIRNQKMARQRAGRVHSRRGRRALKTRSLLDFWPKIARNGCDVMVQNEGAQAASSCPHT